MYYYLTTLNEEFKYYFKRKITLATLLYITNRYVPLAYAFYNAPLFAYSSNLVRCTCLSLAHGSTTLPLTIRKSNIHSFDPHASTHV